MKILSIHSDFLEFKPVSKAIKDVGEVKKVKQRIKDCLVIFSSIERSDEKNPELTAKNAASEIIKIAEQVRARNIVLYPFVHLTSEPSSPRTATTVLDMVENMLNKKGFNVNKAPFGWYKSFTIKCKGHPLAELSRDIKSVPEKKIGAVKGEKFHKFVLVDTDGKEYNVTRESWKRCPLCNKKGGHYDVLRIFVRNELAKKPPKEDPKHIEYMRKLELVDYCPESDVGHLKWYPRGGLIFDLIHDYALFNIAVPWGAFKIKNPMIYRKEVEEIGKLMGEFHERDYSALGGNKEFILRFASDPGAFPFMKRVGFSHKQMPLKCYEEAMCFRREQAGEVVGLRRSRQFNMTDMHAFCKDDKEGREQFEELCEICAQLMDDIFGKGQWVLGWEGTEEFYNKNKDWLKRIGKKHKVPAFFKLMKEMTHYYTMKNEYQVVGADEANVQISTVQWDVKNGKRFDICYVDEGGKRIPVPVILHCSTFGSIERSMYGLLEIAAKKEAEGKPPMFPLWLSPIQVRIIPVSNTHLKYCGKLMKEFERVRVELDDRDETLGKKVRDAEKSWIPFVVVVGEKEQKSGKVSVRDRRTGKQSSMKIESLVSMIRKETEGMPYRPSYLPKLVSKHPIFVG